MFAALAVWFRCLLMWRQPAILSILWWVAFGYMLLCNNSVKDNETWRSVWKIIEWIAVLFLCLSMCIHMLCQRTKFSMVDYWSSCATIVVFQFLVRLSIYMVGWFIQWSQRSHRLITLRHSFKRYFVFYHRAKYHGIQILPSGDFILAYF